MISLETAKRLAELGCSQDLRIGDWCWNKKWSPMWNRPILVYPLTLTNGVAEGVKLPSLEQIIEEVWRRGYDVQLRGRRPPGIHRVCLSPSWDFPRWVPWDSGVKEVWDKDVTEAVAKALIQVIKASNDAQDSATLRERPTLG